MTLRARLTIFFVGIVVVPLLVAGFVLRGLVAGEVDRRANTRLQAAARTVDVLWSMRLRTAQHEVRTVASDVGEAAARDRREIPDGDRLRRRAGLGFLVITGPGGRVLESSIQPPSYPEGVRAPGEDRLAAPDPPPGVLRARIDVPAGGRRLTVAGGWFADNRLVQEMAEVTGVEVAMAVDERVVGATAPLPPELPEAGRPVEIDGDRHALMVPVRGTGGVLLIADQEGAVGSATMGVMAAAGLILAVLLGWLLAGAIVRPLERLAAGAHAVAAGDLDVRVDVGGQGDVAGLGEAFNAMTAKLRTYVAEVEGSRDELRRELDRLGAALRSTHDLPGILGVVVETTAAALGARSAAIYLVSADGSKLELQVACGYGPDAGATIPMGEGIAGRAATGVAVRLPGDFSIDDSAPVEPPTDTAIAVPLVRRDRTMGVIALYGRTVPEPFGAQDLRTLETLASQAASAIENVLLHQEAQRLSRTDSLTGVANRRALETTLTREVERAQRFDRPLSVLLLDLDRFKDVNDAYGHRRGDELLVEVTRRIREQIRTQIDTLARYGGEEFVILLPETPEEGARVVAEKVRAVVRERPFLGSSGPEILVTVSVGTATFPRDGVTADELLRAADEAMYRAKEEGRDRVAAARIA